MQNFLTITTEVYYQIFTPPIMKVGFKVPIELYYLHIMYHYAFHEVLWYL